MIVSVPTNAASPAKGEPPSTSSTRISSDSVNELPKVNRHEREFFIDNLLVRIHLIIEMTLVDRPCAM